jgi:hypothetical protein
LIALPKIVTALGAVVIALAPVTTSAAFAHEADGATILAREYDSASQGCPSGEYPAKCHTGY